MTDRYSTYSAIPRFERGVVDSETGNEYLCVDSEAAKQLAALLNRGQDCRFNCRARREADYLQGWVDRDRDCTIKEKGERCAKRYVDGAESGLKQKFTASGTPDRG